MKGHQRRVHVRPAEQRQALHNHFQPRSRTITFVAQAQWRVRHCRGRHVQRAVSRSVAQQIAASVEWATAPFSVFCPLVRHRVRRTCHPSPHLHPDNTVLSVDGIGAFDLVSRVAMFLGLRNMEGRDTLLPFVVRNEGVPHHSSRGKGGNKATS